jgi:hypothetical protein
MAESDLYEPTEQFAHKTLDCWETRIKASVSDVGEVDVLGVRYIGGDLSGQSEVIANRGEAEQRPVRSLCGPSSRL